MDIKNLIRKLLSGSATLLLSGTISASMQLDRMIVYFDPDKLPREDIVVTNYDKENLYLKTEIYKVINPGTDQEEHVRVTDPAQLKLLTTPQKTIIKPGARRTIRLVSIDSGLSEEQVYRVTFRPVLPDSQAKQNAIKLLIAYQALVFVRPKNIHYNVSVRKEKDGVTFTNNGNASVILRKPELCEKIDEQEQCEEISRGKRIYAGQQITMPVEIKGKYLQYGVFDGSTEKREILQL